MAPREGVAICKQRHGARQRRPLGPHPVKRADSIDQPLRIIQPIDADRELLACRLRRSRDTSGCVIDLAAYCANFFGIDTDREDCDPRPAVQRGHDLAANRQAEILAQIGLEVLAIVVGLGNRSGRRASIASISSR